MLPVDLFAFGGKASGKVSKKAIAASKGLLKNELGDVGSDDGSGSRGAGLASVASEGLEGNDGWIDLDTGHNPSDTGDSSNVAVLENDGALRDHWNSLQIVSETYTSNEASSQNDRLGHILRQDIPSPSDGRFTAQPWPGWVKAFREQQWDAAQQIVELFNSGVNIVWLDAPTGTGKTLIAEMVRRMLDARAWYVCSTKALQDQFVRDFDYSKVVKGRSNYPTELEPFPEITAADCTKTPGNDMSCNWCSRVSECLYEVAKGAALDADLGVLNTSYFITEANNVGKTTRDNNKDLVVVDEADTLENILMGYVQYSVSARMLERLGLEAPKKGVWKTTILTWLEETLTPTLREHLRRLPGDSSDVRVIRDRNNLRNLLEETARVVDSLRVEIESNGDSDDEKGTTWVRDNEAGPMVLKPVKVDNYGYYLWNHSDKWLCMSGTLISTDELNESLGVNKLELTTATVTVPMLFPVENREVLLAGVADNTYKNRDVAWKQIALAVKGILAKHPNDRILVHTVSYKFTKYLKDFVNDRRVITYGSEPGSKDRALAKYRSKAASVLFAPSMDRGVDLKDEDCRVVVVAKVPFLALGDRQVSARLNSPGGQVWYDVQCVRTLIQMTGRGVRSEDDWCLTYILDSQFSLKKWKMYLPQWWRDAVRVLSPRERRELLNAGQ